MVEPLDADVALRAVRLVKVRARARARARARVRVRVRVRVRMRVWVWVRLRAVHRAGRAPDAAGVAPGWGEW